MKKQKRGQHDNDWGLLYVGGSEKVSLRVCVSLGI